MSSSNKSLLCVCSIKIVGLSLCFICVQRYNISYSNATLCSLFINYFVISTNNVVCALQIRGKYAVIWYYVYNDEFDKL